MLHYRLSAAAQADIVGILAWTHAQFGEAARQRYEALIAAALRDIAVQPDRPGSIKRPELGPGIRSWHLRLSRDRARMGTGAVQRPRHFVVYRFEPGASPASPSSAASCTMRWNWRGTWGRRRSGSSALVGARDASGSSGLKFAQRHRAWELDAQWAARRTSYHVTSRGDRREAVFEADADRAQFLGVASQGLTRFDAQMLAYCLMGNHYHFVLFTRQANLEQAMRAMN